MAFEGVDVSSLRSSITACKNAINYRTSEEILGDISVNNVWLTGSRDNLRKAMTTLINTRYKDLEKLLNSYEPIVNMIENYKELEEENKRLKQQYLNLKQNLYYSETYNEEIYDMGGKKRIETKTRTCKNYGVENDMYSTMARIEANERKMEEIKNSVSSAI